MLFLLSLPITEWKGIYWTLNYDTSVPLTCCILIFSPRMLAQSAQATDWYKQVRWHCLLTYLPEWTDIFLSKENSPFTHLNTCTITNKLVTSTFFISAIHLSLYELISFFNDDHKIFMLRISSLPKQKIFKCYLLVIYAGFYVVDNLRCAFQRD